MQTSQTAEISPRASQLPTCWFRADFAAENALPSLCPPPRGAVRSRARRRPRQRSICADSCGCSSAPREPPRQCEAALSSRTEAHFHAPHLSIALHACWQCFAAEAVQRSSPTVQRLAQSPLRLAARPRENVRPLLQSPSLVLASASAVHATPCHLGLPRLGELLATCDRSALAASPASSRELLTSCGSPRATTPAPRARPSL